MRRQRASVYQRHVLNEFASSSSQFIDLNKWDACVRPGLGHVHTDLFKEVFVGIDASVKHDQAAVVVVSFEKSTQMVRLLTHRVFQPSPSEPLDFEMTIEGYLLDLKRRFQLRLVRYDPYQMVSTAQRLAKAGIPIEEFPQSSPNLTAASQNLFELIQSQALVLYPDEAMRLAISRAVAIETPRGWRIGKDKSAFKIDVVIGLAMACHAACTAQGESNFDCSYAWVDGTPIGGARSADDEKARQQSEADSWQRHRLHQHLRNCGIWV
jgi:phage terminase large subunit-like protein